MSKSVRFHLRSTIWINALLSCCTCLQSCIRMQRRKSMKIIIVRAQVNKIEIKSRSLMTVCLSYTHLTKITSLCLRNFCGSLSVDIALSKDSSKVNKPLMICVNSSPYWSLQLMPRGSVSKHTTYEVTRVYITH